MKTTFTIEHKHNIAAYRIEPIHNSTRLRTCPQLARLIFYVRKGYSLNKKFHKKEKNIRNLDKQKIIFLLKTLVFWILLSCPEFELGTTRSTLGSEII